MLVWDAAGGRWAVVLSASTERPFRPLPRPVGGSYDHGVRDLLRAVWREPRAPDPPRRRRRDWALVGVLVVVLLVEGLTRQDVPHRAIWLPLGVGLLLTLLWRRDRPLLAVAIAFTTSTATSFALGGEQSGLITMVAMVGLPYALVRWASGREAVIGVVLLLPVVVLVTATGAELTDVVGGLTVLTASMALGLAFRYRARARARELDRVALLERERLARDLHDTVAHHVSAMAIRAQAGIATAPLRPDAAVDALRLIETEAARTLAEMRTIVRALRRGEPADGTDLAPNKGIADVPALARPGVAGPSVDVEVSGDAGGVHPAVAAAVYRLAQESVTNACRHARDATRVRVRVAVDDASVRLQVCDDGADVPDAPAAGYGIPGMRERADLLGGTCAAGPDPAGGWTVSAVLPRTGTPA
jgi:signal transduction histidine kinase